MPFLYIVGVSNSGHSFKLAYCFLPSEIETDYSFAIRQLYLLYYCYNLKPKVLIMDKEQALKNALRIYFPGIPQLLCLQHINKNVLTYAQSNWVIDGSSSNKEKEKVQEHREIFMKCWASCHSHNASEKFTIAWHELIEDYRD